MGGYAPYSSNAGILTSSMKMHDDRPGLAPRSVFLMRSILVCMVSYVT